MKRHARVWSSAALCALCLLPATLARAVFLSTTPVGQLAVTLRVGTNLAGAIDTVDFAVTSGPTGLAPMEVVAAAPVRIEVLAQRNALWTPRVVLTAHTSGPGLACSAGGCGSTSIPFSQICWTSSDLETGALAGQDIQSGCFTGAASQPLAAFGTIRDSNRLMRNDLLFRYLNTTPYPSGEYTGRVVFTATMDW